jgi:hypothetical protein
MFFSGHFYVHRRCAIWSDKVKIKMVKSEESEKKSKEIETYVGVDQVRQFQFNIIVEKS